LSEEVEALAREIAGTDANAKIQELARRVAEAQIDLRRVRYACHQLLSHALSDPYYDSRENMREKAAVMRSLLRWNAPDIPLAVLVKGEVCYLDAGRAAEICNNPVARGQAITGHGPV
jgi:hypothetical protein